MLILHTWCPIRGPTGEDAMHLCHACVAAVELVPGLAADPRLGCNCAGNGLLVANSTCMKNADQGTVSSPVALQLSLHDSVHACYVSC